MGADDHTRHRQLLATIAQELEALRPQFPQLAEFSAATNFDPGALRISYQYRTGPPQGRGGWTAGVPAPLDDGVWLYIDLHAADSTAQIHTQPATGHRCFEGMRLAFLIREGAKARPLAGAIGGMLEKHGVTRCP